MKKFVITAVAAVFALGAPAAQASLMGEYWNIFAVGDPDNSDPNHPKQIKEDPTYLDSAKAIIAANPTADSTFISTGLNYPRIGGTFSSASLASFLGDDSLSLTPDYVRTQNDVLGSIFRFTGEIYLEEGENKFEVISDDGFEMMVDGTIVDSFSGLRRPNDGLGGADDPDVSFFTAREEGFYSFSMIYYEGKAVEASLNATVNGRVIGAVPVPAALPLMLGGFALMAGMKARRRKAAA